MYLKSPSEKMNSFCLHKTDDRAYPMTKLLYMSEQVWSDDLYRYIFCSSNVALSDMADVKLSLRIFIAQTKYSAVLFFLADDYLAEKVCFFLVELYLTTFKVSWPLLDLIYAYLHIKYFLEIRPTFENVFIPRVSYSKLVIDRKIDQL